MSSSATAPALIPVKAHQTCWVMKPAPASTKPPAATRAMTTAKGRASPSSQEWVARNGVSALAGLTQMSAVTSQPTLAHPAAASGHPDGINLLLLLSAVWAMEFKPSL
jgi:hypothetical protein